jgi:hypothetical protein|tara:strand:+ start:579 stop:785 length:207 start_codon:yes stop_codon:yes gene_type:complete
MSEKILAFNVRIMDSDNVERSGLQIVFNGTRIVYKDVDEVEYERQTLLGADFVVPEPYAARMMHKYGG